MAYLKNDYKLIYDFADQTGAVLDRSLKATKTVPVLADPNVVYKKVDGTEVDPKSYVAIYEQDGNFYGKTESGFEKFSLYSGNDCIFGDEVQPGPVVVKFPVSANATIDPNTFDVCWNFEGDDPVTSKVTKMIDQGTKVKIYLEPNIAQWDTLPTTCKVNGIDTTLTAYQTDFYYVEVTVNAQVDVVFDTGTTRPVTPP